MSKKLENLEVYRSSIELAKGCFEVREKLHVAKRYALAHQIEKSAIAIPSNLSEGNAVRSSKVFLRHVNIALGSAHELLSQLELSKLFAQEDYVNELEKSLEIIIRRMFALRNYLERVTGSAKN